MLFSLELKHRIALISFQIALLSVGCELLGQSTFGTVNGVVTGDDGSPLAGLRITASETLSASLNSPGTMATGVIRARAVSTSSGSFVLENLPSGTYTLCAQGSSTYLDLCHWSQTPPTITVAANEKKAVTAVKLPKGALLQIHLNDSKNLLDSGPNSPVKPHVLIGVSSPSGHFFPVLSAGSDATGRNHKLLVPLHTNLELKVITNNVNLTDSAQQVVPPGGYSLPFRIDAASSQIVTFNVTGTQGKN